MSVHVCWVEAYSLWPHGLQPARLPVPGILHVRILEWVAISFSNAWKWKVKVKSLSRVRLFTTPWTATSQAPPSMGFATQEDWSGVPLPSPREPPAAAAAKSLQSCPTLCDPIDGSPPGSPSLGFSRQEHWSGLPFPSPMHESEKWKWQYSTAEKSRSRSQVQGLALIFVSKKERHLFKIFN